MKKEFCFSKKSKEKLKGVHPVLIKFAEEMIKETPFDFRINEGVRTLETQQEYYTWGRTKFITTWGEKINRPVTSLDGVNRKSKHQIQKDGYAHAFDIAFLGKTQADVYDMKKFKALIKVVRPLLKKYGVKWGGDFKSFPDPPHFELM